MTTRSIGRDGSAAVGGREDGNRTRRPALPAGSRRGVRGLLPAAVLFAALGGLPATGSAQAPPTSAAPSPLAQSPSEVDFAIAPQPLSAALLQFRLQSGFQVAYRTEDVRGLTTQGVTGRFTPEAALRRLLAGSGLGYRVSADKTVTLERTVVQEESGPMRLDPVTVTARRTEELLQDVPGSVFVLSSEEIERSNLENLEDVALRSANLNVTDTGDRAFNNVTVRGISDLTGTQTTGPAVGFYVDEVLLNPSGSTIGIDPNLLDLERVEVLYGPQGTAFGRGTIGGAVNYVTKKPTETFEAELGGEVGSHPDGRLRGVINGSLTGNRDLMARLVAFGRYDDGFVETPNIGGSNDEQDYGARLSLRSQAIDRLTLDLAASFDRRDYRVPSYATVDSLEDNGDLEFLNNVDDDRRIDRGLVTLRGSYDFDFGTLIANTSYLDVQSDIKGDNDFSELDNGSNDQESTEASIGQEIRFESEGFSLPWIEEASFLLGGNGSWTENELFADFFDASDTPFFRIDTGKDILDIGAFGEIRVRPVENLELSVGGRFTYNEVEVSQAGFEDASQSFTNFSPKGSILYAWTDSFATYALISTGFKSGGFNALGTGALSGRAFDNETAVNYEGGVKSRWFDDRLFVNVSGFALFYDDLQVSEIVVVDPTTNLVAIDNAASARSIGGELEVVALPLDGLQLNFNYGYADARFIDYEDAPNGDLSGDRLPNAARHTLSLVADYSHPVLNDLADAYIRAEYSYTSDFKNVTSPFRPQFDGYDLLNLRLGLRGDSFDLEAFVENVFDERYATGEVGATAARIAGRVSDVVEVGTTRRFGIRGRIRF